MKQDIKKLIIILIGLFMLNLTIHCALAELSIDYELPTLSNGSVLPNSSFIINVTSNHTNDINYTFNIWKNQTDFNSSGQTYNLGNISSLGINNISNTTLVVEFIIPEYTIMNQNDIITLFSIGNTSNVGFTIQIRNITINDEITPPLTGLVASYLWFDGLNYENNEYTDFIFGKGVKQQVSWMYDGLISETALYWNGTEQGLIFGGFPADFEQYNYTLLFGGLTNESAHYYSGAIFKHGIFNFLDTDLINAIWSGYNDYNASLVFPYLDYYNYTTSDNNYTFNGLSEGYWYYNVTVTDNIIVNSTSTNFVNVNFPPSIITISPLLSYKHNTSWTYTMNTSIDYFHKNDIYSWSVNSSLITITENGTIYNSSIVYSDRGIHDILITVNDSYSINSTVLTFNITTYPPNITGATIYPGNSTYLSSMINISVNISDVDDLIDVVSYTVKKPNLDFVSGILYYDAVSGSYISNRTDTSLQGDYYLVNITANDSLGLSTTVEYGSTKWAALLPPTPVTPGGNLGGGTGGGVLAQITVGTTTNVSFTVNPTAVDIIVIQGQNPSTVLRVISSTTGAVSIKPIITDDCKLVTNYTTDATNTGDTFNLPAMGYIDFKINFNIPSTFNQTGCRVIATFEAPGTGIQKTVQINMINNPITKSLKTLFSLLYAPVMFSTEAKETIFLDGKNFAVFPSAFNITIPFFGLLVYLFMFFLIRYTLYRSIIALRTKKVTLFVVSLILAILPIILLYYTDSITIISDNVWIGIVFFIVVTIIIVLTFRIPKISPKTRY